MKGLIISADSKIANDMKLVIENMKSGFEMEILKDEGKDFYLIDTMDYDFILNPVRPVIAHDITTNIKPFAKSIMDRTTNYIELVKNNKIVYVDRNKIIGIEVVAKDCYIYMKNSIFCVSRVSLKNMLGILDDPCIVRCHKSYAINVKYVKSFSKETRHRWKVEFVDGVNFDCRVTDFFLEDVIEKYDECHGVKASKFVGLW